MTAATLTLRNTKGSALTFTEMDNNLTSLSTSTIPITVITNTANVAGTVQANAASGIRLVAVPGGPLDISISGNVVTFTANAAVDAADTFFSGNLEGQGFRSISADVLALNGPQVLISTAAFDSTVSGYSSAAAGDTGITSGASAFMIGGTPQANYPARTLNSIFVPDIAVAYQSNASVVGVNIAQQAGWGNVYLGVTSSNTEAYYQFSNVGIKFVDGTVQSTAANPFTGGSLTANVEFNNNYISNAILQTTTEKVANIGVVSGAVTVNANTGPIQTGIVSGNITINTNNLSNFNTGESVTLVLTQATNASQRLLTSNLKYAGASKTLSTANAAIDTISITYDGANYLASLVKGYA